jgi:hypothetical protein
MIEFLDMIPTLMWTAAMFVGGVTALVVSHLMD